MLNYYPPIKPYLTYHFATQGSHRLYVEECGTESGIPVLILPDYFTPCTLAAYRRLFNPEAYRMILFEMRGYGQSTPQSELSDNNTQSVLQDLEELRKYLNIEQWIIFGGGFGATLALLYAEQYSNQVQGLILHSVFLARQRDVDWVYHFGANQIFPEHWQEFIGIFPPNYSGNYLDAYYERLMSEDEIGRLTAAKNWATWHAHCATLQPHPHFVQKALEPIQALQQARIACHYLKHRCFIEENQILEAAAALTNIPTIFVHGRYNMLYPVEGVWALHLLNSAATLFLIRDAGHDISEPGMLDGLIQATKLMANWHERPPTAG